MAAALLIGTIVYFGLNPDPTVAVVATIAFVLVGIAYVVYSEIHHVRLLTDTVDWLDDQRRQTKPEESPTRDRRATLYRRGKQLLVNRVDTTTTGIPITGPEVMVFDLEVSDEELGSAIVAIVGRAQIGVPHPDWDRPEVTKPLYVAAGVSSWRAFVRGTLDVSIFLDDGRLEFLPSENGGARLGFGPIDGSVFADLSDPAAVGRAGRKALTLSR
jgi:hypothetical protein